MILYNSKNNHYIIFFNSRTLKKLRFNWTLVIMVVYFDQGTAVQRTTAGQNKLFRHIKSDEKSDKNSKNPKITPIKNLKTLGKNKVTFIHHF